MPPAAKEAIVRVLMLGAKKYGPYNWRNYPVKLSVYLDAAERHIEAIRRGNHIDEESGQPHAAHAAACLAIILDATHTGHLVNDLLSRDT